MIHSRDNDTPVQPQRKQWGLPGHTTPEKLRFSLNLWISTLLIVWRLQELSKIPEKVLSSAIFSLDRCAQCYAVRIHQEKMVEEGGFEPPKRDATDLQSAPFGHSGTPPFMELVNGLEPLTC